MLLKSRLKLLMALFSLFVLMAGMSIPLKAAVIQDPKPFVVVLDAGHGGHDSGNRGNGYYEKNIALNIALGIGKILEKNKDINVIYTRKTDVFVKLVDRANIANKADADLFVSIHCDAFKSSTVFGAGTFVLGLHANQRNFEIAKRENSVIFYEEDYEKNYAGFDPNNPESVISLTLMQEAYTNQSIEAADAIQKSFIASLGRKDRTVKQAGFVVLKYTYMPSVLVEAGFLTNKNEGAYLNSKKGQNDMARAISKAIINYKSDLEKSVAGSDNFTNTPVTIPDNDREKKDIYFRVQIAASKNEIDPKSYNFKGLSPIYRAKEGGYYKYYFSKSESYKQIQKDRKKAKRQGFNTAFITAFKGDEKIKLSEALDN